MAVAKYRPHSGGHGYVVIWRTPRMRSVAFWEYADEAEARQVVTDLNRRHPFVDTIDPAEGSPM